MERTPLTGSSSSSVNGEIVAEIVTRRWWAACGVHVFALVALLLGIASVDINTSWSIGAPEFFNWHPVLMTLAFVVFAPEAALAFQYGRGSRRTRKNLHVALQTASLVASSIGLWAVFRFHNENGIPNLYSLHSWIGLVFYLLYLCQYVSAFSAFFWPGLDKMVRMRLLPPHAKFGLFAVCALAPIAMLTGIIEMLGFRALKKSQGIATCDAVPMPFACKAGNTMGICVVIVATCTYVAVTSKHKSERTLIAKTSN